MQLQNTSTLRMLKGVNFVLAPLGKGKAALKKLHCRGRAPGPDGLRAEHVRNANTEIDLGDGKVRDQGVCIGCCVAPAIRRFVCKWAVKYSSRWSLTSLAAIS